MKRRIGVVVVLVVIVALLAGGAYYGARMLSQSGQSGRDDEYGNAVRVVEAVTDKGSGPVSVRIIVDPAPGLPDRPAEVRGIFNRQQDNSIFVGTGSIELSVEVNNDEVTFNLSSDGPEVEVIVTRDTVVYEEITDMSMEETSTREGGERRIQQKLRPADSIEDIGENTELMAWGQKRGDRVTARVLVFRKVRPDL